MYHFLNKYGQGLAFGIGTILVAAFVAMTVSDADAGYLVKEEVGKSSAVSLGATVVLLFIFLAITAALVFSVINNLHRPIVAAIAGLLTIAWIYVSFAVIRPALFDRIEASTEPLLENGLTAAQDSFVGMGLNVTLGLIAFAVVAFLFSLVMDFVKG